MIIAAWVAFVLALIVEFAWWTRRVGKRFSWKQDVPLYAFSFITSLAFFLLWEVSGR